MSKVKALYHIVFGTKHRERVINPENARELYAYIWAIAKGHQCFMIRINSMPDHVHVLLDLNPTLNLSTLVRDIKAGSSKWMKESGKFPLFKEWGKGYFAETLSFCERDSVINYIIGQQHHHGLESYIDEMKRLYLKNGIQWYDNDMT